MNAQGSSARGACGPGTRKSGGVELGVGNAAKERRGGHRYLRSEPGAPHPCGPSPVSTTPGPCSTEGAR